MGFKAYSQSVGYQEYYGRESYGNDADFDGHWSIWDEEFLQFFAHKMNSFPQPFATAIFTATSHHPYLIPERYDSVFEEGPLPIHKCVEYVDMSVRRFFETASAMPWYENTLFVICADHTNIVELPEYGTEAGRYMVPIMFYKPDGSLKRTEDGTMQQIDIMPTILGMLDYDLPYIAFGNDLVNTQPDKSFAVGCNNGIYQFFKDGYLLQFDGHEVVGLYDYVSDRMLQDNLVGKVDCSDNLMILKSVIQQYMERMPDEKGYGKTTIKKLEEAKMFLDIQAHTRQVFETEYAEFDSEEGFYEEMTIQSKYEYILKMSDSIQHEYENDNIDDVEIKNLLFSNIPAANRTLCAWVAKPNDSEKKQELYNKVVDYIIDLNMDSRGFDIYNVDDLYIVFNQISDINGLKTLTPENVEKFKGLFEKCKEYIEKNPEEQGYLNLTVSDLDKCQELLDNRDLNNRDVEIDEEVNFIVSPEYLAELDRQDAEREAQERDVVQKAQEQKKANMLKAMVGMTKAKGLVKSQEWMDNLITNYPDKELIAEAAVEFLEKQKETDEHFMDEDSKEARESVFESIVLSGIDNPEIFGRMQKIDRETSKVVVKNVIEQVNSSRSVLNNVVSAIQALGKNINEPEQEVEQDKIVEDTPLGFLKPEETELPKVDMFDNKHGNRGNEEPEDDWIR